MARLREEKGIIQSEVAEAVNVARGTITKYEGGTEAPYGTLMRIARYFDVDPNYLVGWTPDAHKELSEERFLELLEAHGKMMYRELLK